MPQIVRSKKIFNIIENRVENVTPWLAKRMLTNQIEWRIIGEFFHLEFAMGVGKPVFRQAGFISLKWCISVAL